MKKRLSLLLIALSMVVLLTACGKEAGVVAEESTEAKVGIYTDGVHEGIGKGFKGDIKLSVKVENGNIIGIDIVEIHETASIGDVAVEEMIEKIIAEQSTEVDVVSGATGSSKGTIEAVEVALGLREAKAQEDVKAKEASEEGTEVIEYQDGSYAGKAKGFHGDIEVMVTIKDGKITTIDIESMDETPGLGDVAVEGIIENVISKQSTDVDTISGATNSSKGTINAIKAALEEAK